MLDLTWNRPQRFHPFAGESTAASGALPPATALNRRGGLPTRLGDFRGDCPLSLGSGSFGGPGPSSSLSDFLGSAGNAQAANLTTQGSAESGTGARTDKAGTPKSGEAQKNGGRPDLPRQVEVEVPFKGHREHIQVAVSSYGEFQGKTNYRCVQLDYTTIALGIATPVFCSVRTSFDSKADPKQAISQAVIKHTQAIAQAGIEGLSRLPGSYTVKGGVKEGDPDDAAYKSEPGQQKRKTYTRTKETTNPKGETSKDWDATRVRIALAAWGAAGAFDKLDPRQKAKFVELVKACPSKIKGQISEDLVKLLRSGKLLAKDLKGGTLLDTLSQLSTQELAKGLDRTTVIGELLERLVQPEKISQRDRGTCTTTSLEYMLAE